MKKIRWGILSTAKIGLTRMVPTIQACRHGEVVAIASRDLAKAREAARQHSIPRAYGRYEDLLADPDVDAIYNPLPVSLHADWSIRCAEAGKPVLCEKPLALSAAEARRMAEAFRVRKVPLAEALMYRYHPLTRKVKEMVDLGGIGRLQLVRASFTVTPGGGENIRYQKNLGGGSMLDLGCYCVSLMRLLAGEEPDRIHAIGVFGPESDVDEWIVATLRFPSQVLGYLGCSLRSQFDCSYDVTGSAGRILVDWGGMVAWPGTAFKIRHWHGNDYREIEVPAADHYLLMVEDFCDALLKQRAPTHDIADSIANMAVIDGILAAARG